MRDSKTANRQPDTVLTPEERNRQLSQMADRILYRMQYGQCTEKERTELIKQYDLLDRILQRRGGADTDMNAPIYQLLERIDRECGLTE